MIDELLKKYQKYSRMFIGWWITLIATVFLTFINAFTGSETVFYIVIIQIVLTVVSIVNMTIAGAKKNSVVRDIAIKLSAEKGDLYQNLLNAGISERSARQYRADRLAAVKKAETKPAPVMPTRIYCPRCGSEYVVRTSSDLEEFFWLIVLFAAVGSLTPIAVICFGVCAVLAAILGVINKLEGVTVRKMKCRSCGKKFEYRSGGK